MQTSSLVESEGRRLATSRGDPIASLAIAAFLWRLWVRAGSPRGIASAMVEAER